jgi:hypothetical protein
MKTKLFLEVHLPVSTGYSNAEFDAIADEDLSSRLFRICSYKIKESVNNPNITIPALFSQT